MRCVHSCGAKFAGKGIDAGKLLYFDTDASYTSQLAEHKSTGAPFNPKGAIELAGAKAQRTREECEVGWATFAVSTALRTLYLKVQEAEVDGWLQAYSGAFKADLCGVLFRHPLWVHAAPR